MLSATHTIYQTAVENGEVEAHVATILVEEAVKVEVVKGIASSSANISEVHV
jgi:hypothetical protein